MAGLCEQGGGILAQISGILEVLHVSELSRGNEGAGDGTM